MNNDVLDALMHLFADAAQAESLPIDVDIAQQLSALGFSSHEVEQAIDWLAQAPEAPCHIQMVQDPSPHALRVYHPMELHQLSAPCWDMLLRLERTGVLTATMREAVIVQMMSMGVQHIDKHELKWLSLLTLADQPLDDATIMRLLKHLTQMAEQGDPEEAN